MKRCNFFSLMTLALAFVLSACTTPQSVSSDPNTVATPGTKFSACTTDGVKQEASTILDDVASAMATQDYEKAIKDKLGNVTSNVVKCAVQFFVDSILHKAEADELAAVQLARGQAWLAAH